MPAEQRVERVVHAPEAVRRRLHPLVPGVFLVLLVGIVAAAVGASLSRVGAAPPRVDSAPVVADVLVGATLLTALVGAALLFFGPAFRRRRGDETPYLTERDRPPWLQRLVLGLLPLLLLGAVAFAVVALSHPKRLPTPPEAPARPAASAEARRSHGVSVHWIPVLAVVGAIALAAAAEAMLVLRRRRLLVREPRPALAEDVLEAIQESLDDLEREPDPRRAVIRAYERMERTLARHGVARRAAETPVEYLRRALEAVRASADSVTRLTRLFERARFSQHEIDVRMKEQAVTALGALRSELDAR